VGAICDDDKGKQCRGDGNVHAALAVAFFVSYNLNMAILCSRRPGAPHLRAMVALSLATKVRWVRPAAQAIATMVAAEPGTLRAIFEWADIGIIMAWTAGVVCRYHHAARFELVAPRGGASGASGAAGAAGAAGAVGEAGAVSPVALLKAEGKAVGEACEETTDATPRSAPAEVFVPVARIVHGVLLLYLGTLFYCLYLYMAEGRAPRHSALPYISDTFVYPPGDWISRWALPLGSSCCLFVHGCLYYMDGGGINLLVQSTDTMDGGTKATGRVPVRTRAAPSIYWYSLANVAMYGLSMVGCVNETEDWHLHSRGAMIYFVGYDVYMIGRTASLARMSAAARSCERRISLVVQAACAATSALTTIARYAPRLYLAASGLGTPASLTPVLDTVLPVLEWTDALAIACYFGVSVLSHGETARAAGLRIRCGRDGPPASEARSP